MRGEGHDRRRPGLAVWWGAGAGLLFIGFAVAVFAGAFGKDPRQPGNIPLQGSPVTDLELPRLDGSGTVSLADLEGRVLVVNFFASWCDPCRGEHAELTAVGSRYRDRGVLMVGIAYQDETDSVIAFLDELGWGDGHLYLTDPGSRAVIEFGVFGVPETYVISADGIISHKFYGAVDRNRLVPVLEDLLAQERDG
jgi:cytochrome c biogenesis protein CcmG/thiol:disulfide interchange protein DsbE